MDKVDAIKKYIRKIIKEELNGMYPEGPQPGDAEYHHSPDFPKGFGKFENFDWETIFRGLIRKSFSKSDFLEIFSNEELGWLQENGFVYNHDGLITIDNQEYTTNFKKWYSDIKTAWSVAK